jgi:hypothetical protein
VYDDRIYVLNLNALRLRIIQDHHDSLTGDHSERSKTLKLISRQYFWPSMRRDIEKFCRNCHVCKRSQTSCHASYETLRLLSVSAGSWKDLSINFVTELSWLNEYNAVLVIVCRLTKIRHLIHCRDTTTAKQLTDLYVRHVFRLHNLSQIIVSDRETQFVANFWRALCKILKI